MCADVTAESATGQPQTTDSGPHQVPADLEGSIHEFVAQNGDYYVTEFVKIQSAQGVPKSFNPMVAVLGPVWLAARGVWGMFWVFLIVELMALVQISRGLFGDLGAKLTARYDRLQSKSEEMYLKAQAALQIRRPGCKFAVGECRQFEAGGKPCA